MMGLCRSPMTGFLPDKHIHDDAVDREYYKGLVPLIVYKDPFKWIDSLCRQSYGLASNDDIAMRDGDTPIEITYNTDNDLCDRDWKITVSLEQICWLYNNYNEYWINKIEAFDGRFVNYKKLIEDPERTIRELSKIYGMKLKYPANCILQPKDWKVHNSRKFDNVLLKTYMDDQWYEYLTDIHIRTINNNIDWKVYDKIISI